MLECPWCKGTDQLCQSEPGIAMCLECDDSFEGSLPPEQAFVTFPPEEPTTEDADIPW